MGRVEVVRIADFRGFCGWTRIFGVWVCRRFSTGRCGLGKVAVLGRNKESGLQTPPTIARKIILGLGKKDKDSLLFCDLYPFLSFCVKGV